MIFLLMKAAPKGLAKPKPASKPKPVAKPKKSKKIKMPLRTKMRILAAMGIAGAGLATGMMAKGAVTNFEKNSLSKSAYGNHLSEVVYNNPKDRPKIESEIAKRNFSTKPGEIYFWDSVDQKISRITVDPIKMGNIFRLLGEDKRNEIGKVLQEAGGQVWEKYFLSKPIGEIYKDLTPGQIKRLEAVVKTIPTPELQYIQREANMYGIVTGASVGALVALVLGVQLAKIKVNRKKRK